MSTTPRDVGGRRPEAGGLGGVARHLLDEAGQYVQARGEKLIGDAGERLTGAVDRTLGGSIAGEGAKEAVKSAAGGASPAKSLLSGAAGAVKAVFGRGGGRGGRRSTNIIEDIDVGVPISVAYNQWTQFQEFASFMKGVEGVDQTDEVESNWRLKIGLSRRSWRAQIGDQIPDRRITWSSQGAKGSTKGVVSFHPLADDLTKVIVVMEYTAAGPFEKVGNMMRLQLRRVRLDLREFKKFVSMQGEETGAWRGEIRDGEVVSQDEEDKGRESEDVQAGDEAEASQRGGETQAAGGGEESQEEAPPEEHDDEGEREPAASGSRRSARATAAGGGRRGNRR